MTRRPPISTRPGTHFPYTTRFRSAPLVRRSPFGNRLKGSRGDAEARRRRIFAQRRRERRARERWSGEAAYFSFLRASASPREPKSLRSSRPLRESITARARSEEHTSELQSLMRISYAVFCL